MNEVIAMKGGGYYSLATLGAKHVIDGATPLVLDAIAAMPDSREAFVFADMGTADGGTSRDLVERVVETVRRRWPAREIALVYTDQPRNDFNALVGTVHGQAPVDAVFRLFSATSFHRQILPSGGLDLASPPPPCIGSAPSPATSPTMSRRWAPRGPSLPPSPARAMPIGSRFSCSGPASCGRAAGWSWSISAGTRKAAISAAQAGSTCSALST
jgi:hypothetical protein